MFHQLYYYGLNNTWYCFEKGWIWLFLRLSGQIQFERYLNIPTVFFFIDTGCFKAHISLHSTPFYISNTGRYCSLILPFFTSSSFMNVQERLISIRNSYTQACRCYWLTWTKTLMIFTAWLLNFEKSVTGSHGMPRLHMYI